MGARGAIDIFFSERLQETNRGFPGRSYIPFPPKYSSIFSAYFLGRKTPLSNGIKIKKVLWCKDFFNFSFRLCRFFNLHFALFQEFVDFLSITNVGGMAQWTLQQANLLKQFHGTQRTQELPLTALKRERNPQST